MRPAFVRSLPPPAPFEDPALFTRSPHRRAAGRFAAFLFVLFAFSSNASAKPGDTKRFVILHTNDQHGHLLPFSYPDTVSLKDDVAQMPIRKDVGGIARRATLVKQIRAREKNVYLFDAGDCMDGTPFSTEFLGRADYDAMNRVGYDYGVPGNHDFNMTPAQFTELSRLVQFPYLLANVYEKGGTKTVLPPYVIANWDGIKVAIIGFTTYSARTYKAAAEAFEVRDPLDVARELVPELRKKADLVVVVAHDGLDVDQQMAREIPGIDVIVGGHSHTRVPRGIWVAADDPGPNDPPGTVVLQAHQWVAELGRLELTVTENANGKWRVTSYAEQLVPVTGKYADDVQVARTVAGYWDKIKGKYTAVVGQATGDFVEVDGLDPTNYYLMTDAIAEATKAEFELENFGGVRAPLIKGAITAGDLVNLDPFGNTVYTFKITGADLKKLLAETRPATSAALRYSARRTPPARPGARSTWTLVSATLNGQPIQDDKIYSAATSSYYFTRSVKPYATEAVDIGQTRLDVLTAFIRKNSPISPKPDGRNDFGGANPYD